MLKNFFTYFFILTLSIAIVAPAFLCVLDLSNEISLAMDEDIEDIEDIEVTKQSEFKIIPDNNTFVNYRYTTNQNKIIFLAKEYSSIFRNLDSPPPDYLS